MSVSPDFYSSCLSLPLAAGCWGSVSDNYPFHHTLDWISLWRLAEGIQKGARMCPSLDIRDNDLATLVHLSWSSQELTCSWSPEVVKHNYDGTTTYSFSTAFYWQHLIASNTKNWKAPRFIFHSLCRQCWLPSSMSTSMAWWSNSWTSLHCGGATK